MQILQVHWISLQIQRSTADDDSNAGNSTDEAVDLAAQVITGNSQSTTLGYIDTAISRVASHRATLGAMVNRLEFAVDNLNNISTNTSVSRSRIAIQIMPRRHLNCQNSNYSTSSDSGFSSSQSASKNGVKFA